MDISIYKDFCIHISSETPESKHIINMVLNLPDDLGIRILNEFSTRVLCQKIHPIPVSYTHLTLPTIYSV